MENRKTFSCPHCQVRLGLKLNGESQPKQARCPSCGRWIPLPRAEDSRKTRD